MRTQYFAYPVKYLLGSFAIVGEPRRRPIVIVATRRGGSTLLMEMLYSQPGVSYCDQPLDQWRYHHYQRRVPAAYLSQHMHSSTAAEAALYRYFDDLFTGRIRVHGQWNWFDRNYSFWVDRLVVKILNGHALIDWFAACFDVDIVFFVRHPIPTALSICQMGWATVAEAFLRNEKFCAAHLTKAQVSECWQVFHHGTPLEQSVLEWGLSNLYPLSVYQQRNWLTVTYEELMLRMDPICNLLAEQLMLPDPARMLEQGNRPSKNAKGISRSSILTDNAEKRLTSWCQQIAPSEVAAAMHIINDILAIDAYQQDSPMPTSTLCHFGALA